MSGRVSSMPARIRGWLELSRTSGRAKVELWSSQLLEVGSASPSDGVGLELVPVLGGAYRAKGTWRWDGNEVVVDGLDLVIGRVEVFGPKGAERRWPVERDGIHLLVRAGVLTFERLESR
jgi:hypothetical protein